jgi:hypothetical protein
MAIKALAWMVRTFDPPVYCYHEIVHNQRVVDRFRDLGVVFVDDLDEVPEGSPIMLSAHGSAPGVAEAAAPRASVVVDAVCPLVTKVHHEVKVRAGKGYRIVYVGHEGHEEAVGTMAVAPESIDRVESVDEVDRLEPSDQPVALLAQTTLSHRDWEGVADYPTINDLDAITRDEEEGDADGPGGNPGSAGMSGLENLEESGDLYDQAVAVVLRDGKASTSYVQRRLKIGYNRAARLIEDMERAGLVSTMQSNGNREVLVPAKVE